MGGQIRILKSSGCEGMEKDDAYLESESKHAALIVLCFFSSFLLGWEWVGPRGRVDRHLSTLHRGPRHTVHKAWMNNGRKKEKRITVTCRETARLVNMVSKLFEGLSRPAVSVKLDCGPIDSFLERLLLGMCACVEIPARSSVRRHGERKNRPDIHSGRREKESKTQRTNAPAQHV